MTVTAVIAAAGTGSRLGVETPKQFLDLLGRPIVAWSLEAFSRAREIAEIVLVAHPAYMELCQEVARDYSRGLPVKVVPGGHTRQESVHNGIEAASQDIGWVAVHDAARPFITPAQIDSTCLMAKEIGAAIAAAPIVDTVKEVEANLITRTLDRTHLVAAQTPQVCRKDDLARAYAQATSQGVSATDEAGLLELAGIMVGVNLVSGFNFKVTTKADLALARAIAPVIAEQGDNFLELSEDV